MIHVSGRTSGMPTLHSVAARDEVAYIFPASQDLIGGQYVVPCQGAVTTNGNAGQMDGNGHFIRFPATIGSSPAYLPCQIYVGNPDADKLATCKSLQEALSTYLSYQPLGPAPGTEPPPPGGRKK